MSAEAEKPVNKYSQAAPTQGQPTNSPLNVGATGEFTEASQLPNTMGIVNRPTEQPSPADDLGMPGFLLAGGFLFEGEKDQKVLGRQKFITYSDMIANTAIVAAGVRAFMFLVGKPEWSVQPADDSQQAQEYADLVEDIIHDMATPFHQIVRRASLFRFYGFGLQEWTAKMRDDGVYGFVDVETRPQATIYRWDCDQNGRVVGVVQQVPQTYREVYLPRWKMVYCCDTSISDSPEGLGLFRHMVKAADKLARYELLEAWGYETDIRGIPIARVPLKELKALKDRDPKMASALLQPLVQFVDQHNRNPQLGLVIESEPYRSADQTPSSVKRFDLELLKGDASPHADMAKAIERLNRECARVLGIEHMLLGADSKGSHAMAETKAQMFADLIDATIVDLRAQFQKDLLEPLWQMNGWDEELMPTFRTSPLGLSDVADVTASILRMAQAGATLMPNDPVVNKVRQLLGLPDAPEVDPSMLQPGHPGDGPLNEQDPTDPIEETEGADDTGGGGASTGGSK